MVLTSDKVENLNVTDSSVYLKGVGKTKECLNWTENNFKSNQFLMTLIKA